METFPNHTPARINTLRVDSLGNMLIERAAVGTSLKDSAAVSPRLVSALNPNKAPPHFTAYRFVQPPLAR